LSSLRLGQEIYKVELGTHHQHREDCQGHEEYVSGGNQNTSGHAQVYSGLSHELTEGHRVVRRLRWLLGVSVVGVRAQILLIQIFFGLSFFWLLFKDVVACKRDFEKNEELETC
jgi:hypothetical protein